MTLSEIFASDFLREIILRATVVGILISVCSALLGVCLVMRRYSMIGDGLSHVGYFALALGTLAGVSSEFSMEAAVPVVIVAAILILKMDSSPKISGDAACAIVSTGSVALGTIIFSIIGSSSSDICASLFGSSSVLTVTSKDMLLSVLLSATVILWFVLFSRQIFALSFDSQFAASAGCKTGAFGTTLAILTAVTIVIGMKMMGAIMISALIVFPAMCAVQVCRSFKGVVICAAAVSLVTFIAGFSVACLMSLQTGAAVVACQLAVFIIFAVYASLKRYFTNKKAKS
ncbi:MAG: metal ABC transporter permease [Clostridia bacterium]|nr:metal ABC transporter permease [Clostridia bacterium]